MNRQRRSRQSNRLHAYRSSPVRVLTALLVTTWNAYVHILMGLECVTAVEVLATSRANVRLVRVSHR